MIQLTQPSCLCGHAGLIVEFVLVQHPVVLVVLEATKRQGSLYRVVLE